MTQYPIVDFLDDLGLFHEADFVEDQIVREASAYCYCPELLPIIEKNIKSPINYKMIRLNDLID